MRKRAVPPPLPCLNFCSRLCRNPRPPPPSFFNRIGIDIFSARPQDRRSGRHALLMREIKQPSTWRVAVLLFVGWSIVGFTFAGVSYTAALIENRQFALSDALRLNLIQFYLWGAFTPLLFWFSRRFTIELRPVRVRNLLLHFAALVLFAGVHQTIHLLLFWSATPRVRQRFPSIIQCYQAYFGFGFYIDLIIALLITI